MRAKLFLLVMICGIIFVGCNTFNPEKITVEEPTKETESVEEITEYETAEIERNSC